ncbi:MAG: phage tail protein [Pseudomonadota bacterium]
MSLPALPVTADTRTITERVNVLIRDYNNPPASTPPQRLVPAGTVLPFAGSTAPTGFLLCHGQAVSRADHADLFAAIGTTYGAGDGSTTFNLPDLRGRVAAGRDNMGGSSAGRLTTIAGTTLGGAGGSDAVTLTTGHMPSHSHGVNDPTHSHGVLSGNTTPAAFTGRAGQGDGNNNYYITPSYAATGITLQNAGGGAAHQNVQPTLVLNHIIAT